MKKNLIYAVPAVVIMVALTSFWSWRWNTEMLSGVVEVKDPVVMVLGDSTEMGIVDVSMAGLPTFNATVRASSASVWEYVWDANKDKCRDLRYLIVSSDPLSIVREGMRVYEGDYSMLMDLEVSPWDLPREDLRKNAEWWLLSRHVVAALTKQERVTYAPVKRLLQRRLRLKFTEVDPLDYTYKSAVGKKDFYLQSLAFKDAYRHNAEAYRNIFRDCRERGIRVILLRTPVEKAFFDHESGIWEPYHERILAIAEEVLGPDGFVELDLSQDPKFRQEHFADPNHLINEVRPVAQEQVEAILKKLEAAR